LLVAFQPVLAQKGKQVTSGNAKVELKFLDDIVMDIPKAEPVKKTESIAAFSVKKMEESSVANGSLEKANSLQFKYAILLNMEVEQIQNLPLFRLIDEWMGTRYRLGGSTKSGIDCSAFMQVIFSALYGINLPRTAREQYHMAKRISRTELKEGDLVFFNTKGGVSHVGMYLQNNKFVHASSSGVTISDLYDDYWVRKFIGVGRVETGQQLAMLSQP
ncbi:MAG: C40 family peptidase, partial [Flavisolibacter sp.]